MAMASTSAAAAAAHRREEEKEVENEMLATKRTHHQEEKGNGGDGVDTKKIKMSEPTPHQQQHPEATTTITKEDAYNQPATDTNQEKSRLPFRSVASSVTTSVPVAGLSVDAADSDVIMSAAEPSEANPEESPIEPSSSLPAASSSSSTPSRPPSPVGPLFVPSLLTLLPASCDAREESIIQPTEPKSANTSNNGNSNRKGRGKKETSTSSTAASSSASLRDPDRWLLLAVTGQVGSTRITRLTSEAGPNETKPNTGTIHTNQPNIDITSHLLTISTLIYSLGGRIDCRDARGRTPIHWLMIRAIHMTLGEAKVHEEKVDLTKVTRYDVTIESTMRLLLKASESIGYQNPCRNKNDLGSEPFHDQHDAEEMKTRPHLLDLKDDDGNTPMHYCVSQRRVDLVGLLLSHGASVHVKNNEGVAVYDMVEWMSDTEERADDTRPNESIIPSASSSSSARPSLLTGRDVSIYSSPGLTHLLERNWGTHEGLLIEECRFKGESRRGAIKRLIFQQKLFDAAEADPDGDLELVQSLTEEWLTQFQTGQPMFPLVYRADAFFKSPLQTASSYVTEDVDILKCLLRLPMLIHLQPRQGEFAPIHQAMASHNLEAVRLFKEFGANMNHRDSLNGETPIASICMSDHSLDVDEVKEFLRLGADPLIEDNTGNSALTSCVSNGFVNALEVLLAHISDDDRARWVNSRNQFGCSPMHYAFFRRRHGQGRVNSAESSSILALLLKAGGSVDRPVSIAGLTPLQVWTGMESRDGPAVARLIGKSITQIREIIEAPYKRKKLHPSGQGKVLNPDLSNGIEPAGIILRSEFEVSADELPSFTYTTRHIAAGGSFAEEFLKLAAPKRSNEEKKLQELVLRFDRQKLVSIPASTLEVRMTPDKGWGLFTKQRIDREHGIEVIGEIIPEWCADERSNEYLKKNHVWILKEYRLYDHINVFAIDNSRSGNLSRFANHSCDPNMSVYQMNSGRSLVMYPLREIQAGEELTIRYSEGQLSSATIPCHCRAKVCRGQLI